MSATLRLSADEATEDQIREHLLACDSQFSPRLSSRVDLAQYAGKLRARAVTIEAWSEGLLVGLVAGYLDRSASTGFVSNVSVHEAFRGRHVASRLLEAFVQRARAAGVSTIMLEVARDNRAGQGLFSRFGFAFCEDRGSFMLMRAEIPASSQR